MILFDADLHRYTDEQGNIYKSVTSILNDISHIFDETGEIIRRVALRDGLTVEDVREKWDRKAEDSRERGKERHKVFENYIEHKHFEPEFSFWIKEFNRLLPRGRKKSEVMVWNEKCLVAGIADLTVRHQNGSISIFDYKTNANINFFSKYNNKMKHPTARLDDCEYNRYTLQLSFYAWLFEQQGENIKHLAILHIPNPETLTYIPVFYAKETIEKIITWIHQIRTEEKWND